MASNLEFIRSRIADFSNFLTTSAVSSTNSDDDILQQCVQSLQNNVNQIVSEHSDIAFFKDEDLDAYMDSLRNDLRRMEAESASLSDEVENCKKSCLESTCKLESNLESLRHAVDYAKSEAQGRALTEAHVDNYKSEEGQLKEKTHYDDYFEVMKLKYQNEMNTMTLKSLQDLDIIFKSIEDIENIEESLTGSKVIDFEGNIIRISLMTCIPDVKGIVSQLNAEAGDMMKFEVNHELLIEFMDGTMELKNVEIFPNDVYIAEIVEAAKTFRKEFSVISALKTWSSLGWFLQKVQDRIVVCTIRQFMVTTANKSRHLFEYSDKDELIVAHIGGIDAFIRPCEGWPLSTSPLELVSIRSSDEYSHEMSSCLLSKVEEANAFDYNVRKSLTNFVGAIVEILPDKICAEFHL